MHAFKISIYILLLSLQNLINFKMIMIITLNAMFSYYTNNRNILSVFLLSEKKTSL